MTEMNKKPRILVVEDEEINRFYIETFLTSEGYDVMTSENGEFAVECFKKNDFDLVLLDIQMPVMDGYEATQNIRKFEEEMGKKRTPIIAVTAYAMRNNLNKCFDVGMDDYILKPIIMDEALEKIKWYFK
jgi:CheY-like chemotaxis protein